MRLAPTLAVDGRMLILVRQLKANSDGDVDVDNDDDNDKKLRRFEN